MKLSILGGRIVSARCRPSLALVDVPRATGRVAMPQYRKLLTACLRSVVPEAFLSSTSTSIQEDSGTKTEVSHDEGPVSAFHRGLIFRPRKNPQSRSRPIRGHPAAPVFSVGYLGFRAKICLEGCTFSGSPATALVQQARLRARVLRQPCRAALNCCSDISFGELRLDFPYSAMRAFSRDALSGARWLKDSDSVPCHDSALREASRPIPSSRQWLS